MSLNIAIFESEKANNKRWVLNVRDNQSITNNMESIIFLLIVASLFLLIIGFISPKISLFWYTQERTRKKSAEVYGLLLLTFIIVLGLLLTA